MALSLSAEQKSINDIYYNNVQYVIPDYQRSYSWDYDQCNQLYVDFTNAYIDKQDYFMGNIIIARSIEDKKFPELVDGQQRIVTIWLLLKVLSILCNGLRIEENYLVNTSVRKNEEDLLKIRSDVFETNDNEYIKDIFQYDTSTFRNRLDFVSDKNGVIISERCVSKFEFASLLFFQNLSKIDEKKLEDFTTFILDHIFLLPIELSGDNKEMASNRALSIFETINNRGMSLENADIFKAKLYYKAKSQGHQESFKMLWADFRHSTESLKISVDDVFRYYSHIVRARENIISSEKNLRDFFLLDSASTIFRNDYSETMDDLKNITSILQTIDELMSKDEYIGPWLQVLDAYSNAYPKYAIVNYLFVNPNYSIPDFTDFLHKLIRYVYSIGATTRVKYEIYKINANVCRNFSIDNYYNEDLFMYGRPRSLRSGFAILYYYLKGNEFISRPHCIKLIDNGDREFLWKEGWNDHMIDEAIKEISNTKVISYPQRRQKLLSKIHYSYKEYLKYYEDYTKTITGFFSEKQ